MTPFQGHVIFDLLFCINSNMLFKVYFIFKIHSQFLFVFAVDNTFITNRNKKSGFT